MIRLKQLLREDNKELAAKLATIESYQKIILDAYKSWFDNGATTFKAFKGVVDDEEEKAWEYMNDVLLKRAPYVEAKFKRNRELLDETRDVALDTDNIANLNKYGGTWSMLSKNHNYMSEMLRSTLMNSKKGEGMPLNTLYTIMTSSFGSITDTFSITLKFPSGKKTWEWDTDF